MVKKSPNADVIEVVQYMQNKKVVRSGGLSTANPTAKRMASKQNEIIQMMLL